jgi:predicted lactoylglutathione lyase
VDGQLHEAFAMTTSMPPKDITMPRKIYVSLPVKDLERAVDFFAALGFSFNPKFTDDNAAAIIINDNAGVMLVVESYFATLTQKPIIDARAGTEALLAISVDSREAVDALVAKEVAAGGAAPGEAQDHGFMYDHGFEDLDHHQWGVFWMDESQMADQ